MPLEMKQLDCSSCGASLEVKNPGKAKSIICQSCGSQIDLTDPQYGILGRTLLNSAPPRTPITIGMSGSFFGEQYTAIGRVRYREDEWMWDEWLLMTEEGRFKWLTEGERGFTLYDTIVPTNPVDPRQVDDTLNLEGTMDAEVGERGVGTIDYLEGEFTWKAKVGDNVNYLEADFPDGTGNYALEWTDEEVEFFKGTKLTANDVRRAFGLTEVAAPKRKVPVLTLAMITIAIVVLLCLCSAVSAAIGGSGDDSNGTAVSSGSSSSGWGGIFIPSGRSSSPSGSSSRSSSSSGGSSGSGGK